LACLQDTALAYLRRDGDAIPFWRMAGVPAATLRARAAALGCGAVVDCESVPGAGSAPGVGIPSAGVALEGDHTAALRAADPPVIARVVDGRTVADLRTAWTTLPSGRELAFVDVPGHVRFIKNMLAGVGAVDACLFVVAATEGWKPQSEEHLRILELLGVAHGVVALTKVGLVDEEW